MTFLQTFHGDTPCPLRKENGSKRLREYFYSNELPKLPFPALVSCIHCGCIGKTRAVRNLYAFRQGGVPCLLPPQSPSGLPKTLGNVGSPSDTSMRTATSARCISREHTSNTYRASWASVRRGLWCPSRPWSQSKWTMNLRPLAILTTVATRSRNGLPLRAGIVRTLVTGKANSCGTFRKATLKPPLPPATFVLSGLFLFDIIINIVYNIYIVPRLNTRRPVCA